MKKTFILKASCTAFVMALGMVSTPSIAQDYPQTIDTPTPHSEYEPSSQSPRSSDDSYMDQRSGAQGPLRSDDSMNTRDDYRRRSIDETPGHHARHARGASRFSDATRDDLARSGNSPGLMGFYMWQGIGSESP